MDLNLKDKVGIITGASKGIGLAISKFLYQQGMKLLIVARSNDLLIDISNELNSKNVIPFSCDLTGNGIHKEIINYAYEKFGRIDLLVNNAGATQRGDFLELNDGQWKSGFDLKFFSTVNCTKAVWPFLKESKGTIINIIGIGGRIGMSDFAIGGSVNSALINLTKALALKGLSDGIKINAINPGYIKTERLDKRISDYALEKSITYDEAKNRILKEYGIIRFGEPEEIASVVGFLVSDLSNYCQGTIIDVDGGKNNAI